LLLGLPGIFGTTILGWIAVSQIRHSAGKLCGMWLAVFDGLSFPLLALDWVIALLCLLLAKLFARQVLGLQDSLFLDLWDLTIWVSLALASAAAVDFFIIRRVWRAVNKSVAAPVPPIQKPDRFWRWFAVAVFAMIAIPFLISIAGLLAAIAIPNFVKGRNQALALRQEEAIKQSARNAPAASAEIWSPTLTQGEKPDMQKIRNEVKTLMDQGRYEEALQRQIWYFNHALSFGELNSIRLNFGIMNWTELGRHYPKAKQALIEIRDHDVREFSEGRGYSELFSEIQSLNRELQDDGATLALFKTIYPQDKQLAGQCYDYAENLLMQNGDYDLCLNCIGDPQARFESFRRGFEMQRESQQRMDEMRKKYPIPVPPAPRLPGGAFTPPTPPDMGQMATNNFVGQVCKLVEILVATGHQADAEKIRGEAISVLDDPRLKSAVNDAKEKLKK
jgi:tetratricopeptide (TPR) repeat protein